MKALIVLLATISLSVFAQAETQLEVIRKQITNERVGEVIKPADVHGHYVGTCYEGSTVKTEALYVDSFVNTKGITSDLAISTALTYGGTSLPADLSFLLQSGARSWDYMKRFVADGYSGADNNLGEVGAASDFKYLYSSVLAEKTLTVSVGRDYGCTPGSACSPQEVQSCKYGHDIYGNTVFANCIRLNDKTVFKKTSANTLISHRTADGIGDSANNHSFSLAPISSYCKWEKR